MTFDATKYSPYPTLSRPQRRWPDRTLERAPIWCAVDLRDGNQALVSPMSVEQKLKLFQLLVDIGVTEIEVGFPSASQPDFDFVRTIIERGLIPPQVTIQVLTQAREELIARTFESLRGARRAIVHLYNSTSTVQRERVFELDEAGIRELAVRGAACVQAHARRQPDTDWVFEYTPESFTGTEPAFAAEVVNAVVAQWRPRDGQRVIVNLPATVEMSTPNVYADRIEWMGDHIAERDHVVLSIHTHNDRGCGVAAAELGLLAGADRVEGTLLGNGERTGNVDLVTLAMNLYSQGIDPGLDLADMNKIVQTVEQCTGIALHPRHPYAGELVYTAFSGSHQDAIHKSLAKQRAGEPWQVAYLPIDPKDLGRRYEEVVRINSQSGKGGLLHVLERDFGVSMPRWLQIAFAKRVQGAAEEHGGEMRSATLRRMFEAAYVEIPSGFQLKQHTLRQKNGQLMVEASAGMGNCTGEGATAAQALLDGICRLRGASAEIEACDECLLGAGAIAAAMASVCVRFGQETRIGVAFAPDPSRAVLQAVMTAAGRHFGATPARDSARPSSAPGPRA